MELSRDYNLLRERYTIKNKKNYVLDDAQVDIVEALLSNDCYFNCSQTGIGKTFSTLTACIHKMKEDNEVHYVIVIPTKANKVFIETLENFNLPYEILTATKRQYNLKARFHIFNYSTLTKDVVSKNKNDIMYMNEYISRVLNLYKESNKNLHLILDEAHTLQDNNSQQYKVMKELRPLFKKVWVLTATPILNDLLGFYYMVDLVIPNYFGNVYAFRNKFFKQELKEIWTRDKITNKAKKKKVYDVIGYKNLKTLKDAFSYISIVRGRKYDIDFIFKQAKFSSKGKSYYIQASKGLFGSFDEEDRKSKVKLDKKDWGARLHDLQRVVSNSHSNFKYLEDDETLTEKEVLLLETLLEVIKREEATLIYFSYLDTVERVKYLLGRVKERMGIGTIHIISGAISQREREQVESSIKPKDVVLITSAGTESINLQKANNLIFYEIPFSIREFIQAVGRITRTNSKFDTFNVYLLEMLGTIDTYKKEKIKINYEPLKHILQGYDTLPIEDMLLVNNADKEDMKKMYLWCKKNTLI